MANRIAYNGSSKVIKRLCELVNAGTDALTDFKEEVNYGFANDMAEIMNLALTVSDVCEQYGALKIKTVGHLPIIPTLNEYGKTLAIVKESTRLVMACCLGDSLLPSERNNASGIIKINNSVGSMNVDPDDLIRIEYIGEFNPAMTYRLDTVYVTGTYSNFDSEEEPMHGTPMATYRFYYIEEIDGQQYHSGLCEWVKEFEYFTTESDAVNYIEDFIGDCVITHMTSDYYFGTDGDLWFPDDNTIYFIPKDEQSTELNNYDKYLLIRNASDELVWEMIGGDTITVDSELSTSSTNPVQNKIITRKFNQYYDKDTINSMLENLPGMRYLIVDSLPVILEHDASFYFMMAMDYGSTKAYGTAIIMPSYDESEIYYELGGVELPASVDISDYTAFEYASTFPEPGSQDETKIFTIAYAELDREGNPTGNYIVEMDIFYTVSGAQRMIEVGRTKGWTSTEPFVDLEDAQYYAQTFLPSEITIRSVEGYPPAKEGVMYLVPNQESETGNLYDEYMVVRYYDSSENVWVKQYEKIGTMSADLANYYTKTETNALLADKADVSDIPDELSDLQDDSTHRLVTDTEKSTWNGKSIVTANPQATTDTLTSIAINGTAYAIPTDAQGTVTSVNNITPDQNGNVTIDADDVGALPDDTPLFSGDYNDLTNKPTIPDELADLQDDTTHRVVTDTEKMTWNNKSDFSGSYNDLTNKPTIPDELADLSDDSTHRLVTDTEKTTWNNKSDFSGSYNDLTDKPTIPAAQIQSDWNQNDSTALDYIKNKPTIPSIPVQSVNGQTGVVVLDANDVGALPDDTPLFSGDYNDLTNKPTIPDELADLQDDTTHRLVTDTEKSTWNGKSDFSGSYNDLTDKPTIPAAQVNSDWNATSGVAQILNKPTIPAAQIQSDWNQNDSTALDYIKNKPTIPSVPVTSVNGQTGAVVLDANDVGALPDDTPLLEPLIGTTLTLTPTQVSTAIQAGRPVVVSYTDATYGTFIFDSFAVSSGMLIGSQTACIHSGNTSTNMVVVLSADTTNDSWEFHPPTILARRSDIPDELADLQDDATHRLVTDTEKSTWNGKSTVTANPASTTETLTGIEIDGVSYAVQGGGSADLTDAWRVKGGTALTASQESPIDLNTYLTSGTYYMNTDAQVEFVANKPALAQDKRFTLMVQRVGNSGATIKQIFIGGYDNKVFWRFTRNTGSAWFAWEEMAYADKMWRLASGTQLQPTTDNHVDLNTLISAGTYFITSDIADRVDNKPTDSTNRFTLIVQAIGDADEVRIKQIYMPRGTQSNYIRYKDGSTANWSSWKETAFTDAIPTALSQLTDDSTHRLVTDTEKAGWDAKSDFSGSYNDLTDKPVVTTGSVGSASKGTNIAADDITAWSAGTLPELTVSSVACDDITAWSAGSVPSASVSNGRLTLSAGSAPSLSYTARSVGSASGWSAGTLPSLTYTARSIPNISVASVNVVTSIT